MNQTCKVCGEPAAGFHFGAFTCEGCKSFFGRSYNNMSSISECKNNGECVINKKNRTSCKACRLKKCMLVGMSKSGSRYGRRSNWFKIHCLLQEQSQQQQAAANQLNAGLRQARHTPPPNAQQFNLGLLGHFPPPPPFLHLPKTKEELMLLGLDEYKNSASPSISSPESHNSDSSVEVSETRKMPMISALLPPAFLPPHNLFLPPGYPPLYTGLLQPCNNNNGLMRNHNQTTSADAEAYKRLYLDSILQSQRTPTPEDLMKVTRAESPASEPIDLSMKTGSDRGSSPTGSERSSGRSSQTERGLGSEADEEESECDSEKEMQRTIKTVPLDLTTKV